MGFTGNIARTYTEQCVRILTELLELKQEHITSGNYLHPSDWDLVSALPFGGLQNTTVLSPLQFPSLYHSLLVPLSRDHSLLPFLQIITCLQMLDRLDFSPHWHSCKLENSVCCIWVVWRIVCLRQIPQTMQMKHESVHKLEQNAMARIISIHQWCRFVKFLFFKELTRQRDQQLYDFP